MPTPSSKIYRVCLQCSKTFSIKPSKLKAGRGIFCSRKCRFPEAALGPVHCVCARCAKAFDVSPSIVKNGGGVFCGDECRLASYTDKRVHRVCAQCFEIFSVSAFNFKRGGGVFCSKKCRVTKQSADRTAKCVASLVNCVCPWCSKTYGATPWELRLGRKVFCSRACFSASKVEKSLHPEIKFWKYVNKTESCWFWTGGRTVWGYGQTNSLGQKNTSHRLSWEIHNGPIPEGLCVLHKCDVPLCVRPDHLFLGTSLDNARDCVEKRRRYVRLITAFGETKTISEWQRDARCLGTYWSIVGRLDKGFSPEHALTTKPLTQFEAGLCVVISRAFKEDFMNFPVECLQPSCYSPPCNG